MSAKIFPCRAEVNKGENRSRPRENAKNTKQDGLILNGEWRQIFSAEIVPPLRSLRPLRSFVAIQIRSSGLTLMRALSYIISGQAFCAFCAFSRQ